MTSQLTTKRVNTFLLEQAMIHLLAAYGEHVNVDELREKPLDVLAVMCRVLQAQGYTLADVERCWNSERKEGTCDH
jgi:hypothetical protein